MADYEQLGEKLIALLHDDDLLTFIQEEKGRYTTKEEFVEQHAPAGFEPEFVWELLSYVRRVNGRPPVRDQVPTRGKNPYDLPFWTVPTETLNLLSDIVDKAGTHSRLWISIDRLNDFGRIPQFASEDLSAACIRDGIDVDYETVRTLTLGEREPLTPEERIVSNACLILSEAKLDESPLSAEALQHIYETLLLDASDVSTNPSPLPNIPELRPAHHEIPFGFDGIGRWLSANDSWGIHPLFGSILNSEVVWMQRPFESLNGFMEVILRNRMFASIGLPALCFVPLSKIRLDWESGLIPREIAPFRYGEAIVNSTFGSDSTPSLIQLVRFLKLGLDRLERAVSRIEETDGIRKDLATSDPRLSLRQKQFLCELIENPHLKIEVADYARRFGVVTTTAREDLNKLVALKFCFTDFQGKRQVFWPRPDLPNALLRAASGSSTRTGVSH